MVLWERNYCWMEAWKIDIVTKTNITAKIVMHIIVMCVPNLPEFIDTTVTNYMSDRTMISTEESRLEDSIPRSNECMLRARQAGEYCNVPRMLASFLNRDDAPLRWTGLNLVEMPETTRGLGAWWSASWIMPGTASGWDVVLAQWISWTLRGSWCRWIRSRWDGDEGWMDLGQVILMLERL